MAVRFRKAKAARRPAEDSPEPSARVPVDLKRVRFEFVFWRDGEPICCEVEDAVLHYHGGIILSNEDFTDDTGIGHFSFDEFRAPFDPDGHNEELSEVMDEEPEHSIVCGEILEHAPSMEEFELGLSKVVYLGRLVVDPPYRRQGIARTFLWRVLEYYADQGSVGVFLMPAPLRDSGALWWHDPSTGRTREFSELSAEEQAEYERRKEDLIRLYERAGFKRLGISDIWGLSLDRGLPPRPASATAKSPVAVEGTERS